MPRPLNWLFGVLFQKDFHQKENGNGLFAKPTVIGNAISAPQKKILAQFGFTLSSFVRARDIKIEVEGERFAAALKARKSGVKTDS